MLRIDNPLLNKPLLFLMKFMYLGSWGKKYEIYNVNKFTKFKIRVGSVDKFTILDIYKSSEYERHGFKIKKNQVVVDLGAHVGSFSVLASSVVGKGGAVYAYEPDKYSFDLLKFNKRLNKCSNLKLFNIAVWKKEGFVNFSSSDIDSWSSSMFRKDLDSKYSVKAQTLPEIFGGIKRKVDFLKMDIEGAEFEIFKNLDRKDFKNVDKIVLEFHNFIENKANKHMEIVNRLKKFGYFVSIYSIFPLSIPFFGLGIITAKKI